VVVDVGGGDGDDADDDDDDDDDNDDEARLRPCDAVCESRRRDIGTSVTQLAITSSREPWGYTSSAIPISSMALHMSSNDFAETL
jgi:hypothetical protein